MCPQGCLLRFFCAPARSAQLSGAVPLGVGDSGHLHGVQLCVQFVGALVQCLDGLLRVELTLFVGGLRLLAFAVSGQPEEGDEGVHGSAS